jgi:hypothetical protein
VLSFALSSFAAWRGVSASGIARGQAFDALDMRWNAIACGALFVALAAVLERFDRKRHFEPVMALTGWMLVLGALASGLDEPLYRLALLATGGGLAAWAFARRKFSLLCLGIGASFLATAWWWFSGDIGPIASLGLAATAFAFGALLELARRRLGRRI